MSRDGWFLLVLGVVIVISCYFYGYQQFTMAARGAEQGARDSQAAYLSRWRAGHETEQDRRDRVQREILEELRRQNR